MSDRSFNAVVNAKLRLTDNGQRLRTIVLNGERIAAVITQSDLVRPGDDSVWDANGCPLSPGFIDAHMHPIDMGLKNLRLDFKSN